MNRPLSFLGNAAAWIPRLMLAFICAGCIPTVTAAVVAAVPIVATDEYLDPFSPNMTWTVSDREVLLLPIWEYISHNRWTDVAKYDDFEKAVKLANPTIDPKRLTRGQVINLASVLNLNTQVKKQDCLRQVLLDQTGVKCDPNPTFSINANKLAIVRAAVPNGAGIKASTLLALWQKEGSLKKVTTMDSDKATAADARTAVREALYYQDLGADFFTLYSATVKDNVLKDDTAAARIHFDTVAAAFGGPTVPTLIDAELTATAMVLPGPPPANIFRVAISDNFFVLSLGLVSRYWQSKLVTEGPDMTYIKWNTGDGNYAKLVASVATHPDRTALGLVNWALHSRMLVDDWSRPRTNAIKFMFFRQCFLQYDP